MLVKAIVIAAFAMVIIVFGILGMRKTKSFSDYFLGGGAIGPWMTAFTYGTAYFSAVLFIGFAGKVGWGFGYSGVWVAVTNALVGVLGVWFFMGRRIKRMSVELGVHTMAEFFEVRYNSKGLKLFAAICIFVFFIPYSAAVFMGLSYLFRSTFNLDYSYALIFMGLFTAIYLVMGGYKSMTMVDVFFGVIMIFGISILFGSTISVAGGLSNITSSLTAMNPKLTQILGPPGFWPLFSLVFLTSVAPFAMPQLVQKFYAIKDEKSIKIGMVVSTLFALLIGCIGYFEGATTRFFLTPDNAPAAFNNGKPVFDALMPELLTQVIPEALSVVILLLILSASMSTLAALVLISSSSVAKDVYAGFINPNVSDKKLMMLMRILSVSFVLMSVIFAFLKPSTIVTILGISWGAIGAAFLGPFIWGLFTRWGNVYGAWVSATVALGLCLYLYFTGMPSPQAGTIGMVSSLVLMPLVSLLTVKR